jgi:hypothetical protein
MSNTNNDGMQGKKTHQRQREILESGGEHDDSKVPDHELQGEKTGARVRPMTEGEKKTNLDGQPGRQSEFPVSRGGMNQESRQHNKH